MSNKCYFQENELGINNKKLKYYSSPTFIENKFKHGFFTKKSSEVNLSSLANCLNENDNCVLNQIHSNEIVFGSKTQQKNTFGDGIICDENNQNLWIYTADCMPILFADKTNRIVAAIHCGRKGLEKNIIKKLVKTFENLGTSKEDIIVAIGPSISKKNYLLDKKTYLEFYNRIHFEESSFSKDCKVSNDLDNLVHIENQHLIPLDIKKIAHNQLLKEKISSSNIDISTICTYESNNFYSFRRSNTTFRQWSFISSSKF